MINIILKILNKKDSFRLLWITPIVLSLSIRFLIAAVGFTFPSLSSAEENNHQSQTQRDVKKFYTDYHALVVGVGNYSHWPTHPKALNNAQEVSEELIQLGYSVTLLTNPDYRQLKEALNNFIQKAEKNSKRGLIFYYSGHSHTLTSGGKQIGWIIPKDAPVQSKNPSGFKKKAISTDEIALIARKNPSGYMLFLFDTVFSADVFQVEPAVLQIIGKSSTQPVHQFITAGKTGDIISQHSVFHKFLLQGLKGEADLIQDNVVSSSELGVYLSETISRFTHGKQHPQYGRIPVSDHRGDFLLQRSNQPTQLAHLFVAPQPASATVQIMNIKKRFTQGMKLKAGQYKLSVSADGHKTVHKSVDLIAGDEKTINIILPKMKTNITNSLGMQFIRIQQGNFVMGSPIAEPGRSLDETQHQVTLSHSFFMQQTEVSTGQFRKFVQATGYKTEAEKGGGCWTSRGTRWGKNPDTNWKTPGSSPVGNDLPVICVSWNDANAFANWLSKKEKKKYRLPTEAQWEYAARAGIRTPFSSGRCLSTEEANYGKNGHQYRKCATVFRKKRGYPVKVGSLTPNPWRLHNIHGNVSEWCLDWYGPYPSEKITNPYGPKTGSERIMRGGHWKADASGSRSAIRRRFPPNFASDVLGFRLVKIP